MTGGLIYNSLRCCMAPGIAMHIKRFTLDEKLKRERGRKKNSHSKSRFVQVTGKVTERYSGQTE